MQLREVFGLGPANRDHIPAFRIAVGVAVPLLTLLFFQRLDLAIYATFGSFTGLYARHDTPMSRFRRQSLAGLLLTSCVGVGSVLSYFHANAWVIMVASSVMSSVTAMIALRYALRPAGSVFFIFATAAVGSIHGGAHPLLAMLVAAVAAGLAVVLGLYAHLIGEGLEDAEVASDPTLPRKEIINHGIRFLVAPMIAGSLGILSVDAMQGLSHPYWAMVAAAAPIAPPRFRDRMVRSVHRIIGSLAGVVFAAFLLSFPTQPWQLVVWVIVLQFAGELYVVRNYAFGLLFITPVALMMTQLAAPVEVPDLLLARSVETVIGAVVAMCVVAWGYSTENPPKFRKLPGNLAGMRTRRQSE